MTPINLLKKILLASPAISATIGLSMVVGGISSIAGWEYATTGNFRKEKTFSVGDRMPDFGELPDKISFIDSDGDKIIDYTVLPHKCNDKKKLFGFYDFRTNKLHLSENFDGKISAIFPYDGKTRLSDYVPVCS